MDTKMMKVVVRDRRGNVLVTGSYDLMDTLMRQIPISRMEFSASQVTLHAW